MTPGRRIPTAATAPAAAAGRSDVLWSQNPVRRPGGGREERCFWLAERVPAVGTAAAGRSDGLWSQNAGRRRER